MSGRARPPEWERDDRRKKAVLVGIENPKDDWPIEESLAELKRLANTAGVDVVSTTSQRLDKVYARTLIGSGKVDEVKQLIAQRQADIVIFNDDLTPRQQANLEDLIPNTQVLDRTGLILEIFGMHAVSREGKLQVELAQLEYMLPRLRGLWGHLLRERLGGGRGARFGAGESQLETDRRLARTRIAILKRELRRLSATRKTQRKRRGKSGVFAVSLVGYTNAGKSTLLNALTGANVLAYDMLFATLDSTTRCLSLPDGRRVTLSDTVGFINKLPHGLVEAFKSTLDDLSEADLLLHVVDGGHPYCELQMRAVAEVLQELGVNLKPIILVFNKVDVISPERIATLRRRYPQAIFISAMTLAGLEELLAKITAEAARGSRTLTVVIPYKRGDLVRAAYEQTHVIKESHTELGTSLVIQAPDNVAARFEPFVAPPLKD